MTHNKKRLYRTLIKLLTFIGISILSFFLIRSIFLPSEISSLETSDPVQVDLSTISEGKIKIVRWNHRNIAILHRPKEMQANLQKQDIVESRKYFIFVNTGGDVNCPLIVEPIKKLTLKDICSAYLYDGSGKVIKQDARVQNLIIPPYHFLEGNKLVIGE